MGNLKKCYCKQSSNYCVTVTGVTESGEACTIHTTHLSVSGWRLLSSRCHSPGVVRRPRGREEARDELVRRLPDNSSDVYRVSHPIVREVSSCFVLGVPLPCLGSS